MAFHGQIWNHHEKCIEISTNMPSIGFVIPEITCEICEKTNTSLLSETNARVVNVNAFRAAGECRRQVQNLTKFVKNVEIMEFHDHIRNHDEKCIQISTNMPGIGSLFREIAVDISEM